MTKVLQVLILVLNLAVFAAAQKVSERSEKTTLGGTVFDNAGALIPQTKVTFTNQAGKVYTALTNEDGVFKIELNQGKYTIEFYKFGFKRFKIENYQLAFKSKMQFDVSLE